MRRESIMASQNGKSMAYDSMHFLLEQEVIETGRSIFKPINVNPTNSQLVNPFATARAEYVKQLREQQERSESNR